MSAKTIEFVTFKLNKTATVDAFLEESQKLSAWVKEMPGFISRRMSVDSEGIWIDHVEWNTREDALAATKAFAHMPELGPFMSMIDQSSVKMNHLTVKDATD